MRTLTSLGEGESGIVQYIRPESPLRRRLLDIGIVCGTKVQCLQKSVFGDPKAYLIRDTVIAIRNEDAGYIVIE